MQLAMQQQLHFGCVARQGFFALMSPIQRSEQTGKGGPRPMRRYELGYVRALACLLREAIEYVESQGEIEYQDLGCGNKENGAENM